MFQRSGQSVVCALICSRRGTRSGGALLQFGDKFAMASYLTIITSSLHSFSSRTQSVNVAKANEDLESLGDARISGSMQYASMQLS